KDMFTGDIVRYALAAGWMERDPRGLAAWLQEHPRDRGAGALATILGEKISLLDRETVAKLSAIAPAGGYPGQLLMEWETLAEDGDVKGLAMKMLATMKGDYERGELLRNVVDHLSTDNPRDALDFLFEFPLPDGQVPQIPLASAVDA